MVEVAAKTRNVLVLGWREWVALPGLEINRIDARVDTGAPATRLQVFFVETLRRGGRERVRFGIHPAKDCSDLGLICEAELLEWRVVSVVGGQSERLCVIETDVVVGTLRRRIEVLLAGEDAAGFRMVLGRTALTEGVLVDPAESYLAGKPKPGARI